MNKVTSKKLQYLANGEESNSTNGKTKKLQETVSCQSTGDSSYVMFCKQNVFEKINQNTSESFKMPG